MVDLTENNQKNLANTFEEKLFQTRFKSTTKMTILSRFWEICQNFKQRRIIDTKSTPNKFENSWFPRTTRKKSKKSN